MYVCSTYVRIYDYACMYVLCIGLGCGLRERGSGLGVVYHYISLHYYIHASY